MTGRVRLETKGAPAALGPYSQGIDSPECGLVFVSGQIGIDPATGSLVPGGVVPELCRALENVRAILAAAGTGFDRVVRITLFLADMADFAAVNGVYAEYFAEPYPARSTVQAAALPKGGRVELEVTAVRPS